ncbi:hypothetical protein [Bifidobacterium pseudolongum]|uniref:hypothetical protein n=1 Tax=Bifidobacterium pseudolongum TaxID=1694 RepID=UPI001177832A|nr:hypothetical protein [Bifidobacterium pseudolongum]
MEKTDLTYRHSQRHRILSDNRLGAETNSGKHIPRHQEFGHISVAVIFGKCLSIIIGKLGARYAVPPVESIQQSWSGATSPPSVRANDETAIYGKGPGASVKRRAPMRATAEISCS